jgi:hypothetical protein
MPLSDDPWINDNSIIDPERLHALGVMTMFWNHCERNLFLIFCDVFHFSARFGWIIAHDLGDISLAERITEILRIRPRQPDEQNLILNALAVYNVCRQNRNTLTHFNVKAESVDTPGTDFKFVRLKGPSGQLKDFPCSLQDVREVAFNTKILSVYLHKMHEALTERNAGKDVPLPPILAAPALLSSPLPQADTARQPQRPPSVLKLTEEEWLAKYRRENRPLPKGEG